MLNITFLLQEGIRAVPGKRMMQMQTEEPGQLLWQNATATAILHKDVITVGKMIDMFAVTQVVQHRAMHDLRVAPWRVLKRAAVRGTGKFGKIPDAIQPS